MSDTTTDPTFSPPAETSASAVWAVSLVFWITLLLSALLYGSVAMAPRLSAWLEIRHDFISNAHQLQALEAEVDYLERVRDTLRSDPDFVRRLAAASVAPDVGDAEVIPVSGTLIFGSEAQLQNRLPDIEDPWGTALAQRFAGDESLRRGLLVAATGLIVFAFTVLNGTGGWFVRCVLQLARVAVRLPLARYRRGDDAEIADRNAGTDGD